MKGYKGFDKDFKCLGKQYKDNETFVEDEAIPCEKGMHFCRNPLDVLDFYPPIDYDGNMNRFAKVECKEAKTNDNIMFCTNELEIHKELTFEDLIEEGFNYIWNEIDLKSHDNGLRLASSGYGSLLASSGDFSELVNSGDFSELVSSGDYSKLVNSGFDSQLIMIGKNNIGANVGIRGTIKGKIGDWITLAEYNYSDGKYKCVCVKSAQIDGVTIKEDVFYKLVNGEFVEVY